MAAPLASVVQWLDQQLGPERFQAVDGALNGLQVGDLSAEVCDVAVACDACDEVIARAQGRQLLLVHHGLFWGKVAPISGRIYCLIRQLIAQGCALYASHLPLDAHPRWGNNVALAQRMGLKNLQPFAHLGGIPCGVWGELSVGARLSTLARQVFPETNLPQLFPFGKEQLCTVAVCSGSGGFALQEAIDLGVDVLVTGDINHSHYHRAREARLSIVAGGHYASETAGVQALGLALAQQYALNYNFIEFPTGI